MITTFRAYYDRHQRWLPIAFFILGFVFDAIVLHRIDEPLVIVQQAVYLLIASALICVELLELQNPYTPPKWLTRIWTYREAVLHFLMGTLLNAYTIFFFKSASALTAFVFIVILVLVLVINEFKRFGDRQTQVHGAIFGLCLISYFAVLSPILLGFIGDIPFLCANIAAWIAIALYHAVVRLMGVGRTLFHKQIVLPFLTIQILFAVLYFLRLIPPVPLSVMYMGIFHDVQRSGAHYELSYEPQGLRFWHHGDQSFRARPGDTIHCFVRIFAPARFRDQLQVRWLFKDAKQGWIPSDAIPLAIAGGREEGFRGVTKKNNYQPGSWRVQIETMDGREVGRIGFEVSRDDESDERSFTTMLQ